jgi:hypothetical protein
MVLVLSDRYDKNGRSFHADTKRRARCWSWRGCWPPPPKALTLDEIAERMEVAGAPPSACATPSGRLPPLEVVDEWRHKRFRIPSGLDGLFQAPPPRSWPR